MLDILFCTFSAFLLFYYWWISPYSYWKKRGFPYIESKFPFGTCKRLALIEEDYGYLYQKLYNQAGDKSYAGFVAFRRPQLLLKDVNIIKEILLKDFTHFTDRPNVDYVKEPLSRNLFNIGGDKWKALRIKLTPTFSSGKMKLMFPLFEMCSKNLEDLIDKLMSNRREIDVKDMMNRYSTKIIGTCAYGLEIDTLGDEDNKFVKCTRDINLHNHKLFGKLISCIHHIFPGIELLVKLNLSKKSNEIFLKDIVLNTMTYRSIHNVKRNDFIDLIMDIRKQKSITVDSIGHHGDPAWKKTIRITDDDLVAQVFVFLAAGYETSSSVMSNCLFELAVNKDIQEKLRQEILDNQPLTYTNVQKLTYLDMVIHETMRKYPTLPTLTRKCTKNYRLPDGTELEKGIRVVIPVYSLHHDPKYFPDPDKFDPERFSTENKNKRHNFCYLPFGEGPRACIGLRFGLLQVKMGIATILAKSSVEETENTIKPLRFVSSPVLRSLNHPINLRFQPLES